MRRARSTRGRARKERLRWKSGTDHGAGQGPPRGRDAPREATAPAGPEGQGPRHAATLLLSRPQSDACALPRRPQARRSARRPSAPRCGSCPRKSTRGAEKGAPGVEDLESHVKR